MGVDIAKEALVFFATALTGMFCGVVFDLFSLLQKSFKKRIIITFYDVISCGIIFFSVFIVFLTFNAFQLRWYMFLGLFLGGVIYFFVLRRFVLFIIEKIMKIFDFIFKILLTPGRFLYKIIIMVFRKIPIARFRDFLRKKMYVQRDKKRMEIRMKKESTRTPKKNSKIPLLVLFGLVAFFVVQGVMLQPDISNNKDKIEELNAQIEYEKQRAEEVDGLKENVDSDEYKEKIEREKLGMIRKDEIVFIDVTGEE